jgi:DNA polymerase-3 subunit delta
MAAHTPERLLNQIAKGKPVPTVLLLGTDVYLRDLCRKKLLDAYVPAEMREWAVTQFSADETEWDEIFQRAQTVPMLAPRQVLFLTGVEAFEKLGEEAAKQLVDSIGAYLDDPAPFTVLVFEAAALDERRRIYKLLSEKALLVELTVGQESAAALALEMARQLDAKIDGDAAALLAEILNGEPARIHIELEKLAVYVGERKRITTADVEALVVSEKKYSVWQLADILAARRRDAALTFLDSVLREGEQPPAIVGALAWMYRKLIEASELSPHASKWQAAGQLGMRPETAELAIRQSRKISRKDLLDGIVALAEADSRLKSGTPDQRAVMEFLVARLTGTESAASS